MAYDQGVQGCLVAIEGIKKCPLTVAMKNHKVQGSSLTVFDWVWATLSDLEVAIMELKNSAGEKYG